MNELLQRLSGTAGWSPVQISADIDVTFGGRLYGLLSESERRRCDATLALAIATISGLRLALLDRLDVLDLPSRSQALTLLRAVTMDKEIDSVIVAGTLKEAMAKRRPGYKRSGSTPGNSSTSSNRLRPDPRYSAPPGALSLSASTGREEL